MAKKQTQEKLEVPKGLKILCILSFLGFAVSMAVDAQSYLFFSSIEEIDHSSLAFENMEDFSDKIVAKGYSDVDENGLIKVGFGLQIAKMYIFRAIIDIIALLGVSMMFVRLKMGYTIYVIGQFSYILVPIAMFGLLGAHIIGPQTILINLIYVLLFTTQRRHLIR